MTKILVVEDDKGIVENLTEFLTKEGFEVTSANGQRETLELIEKESFELVLLDISLADGNGFSVCSAIKAEYDIPVFDAFTEIEIDYDAPNAPEDGVHFSTEVMRDVVAPKIIEFIKNNYDKA